MQLQWTYVTCAIMLFTGNYPLTPNYKHKQSISQYVYLSWRSKVLQKPIV